MNLKEIIEIKNKYEKDLLALPNVIAVGVGFKNNTSIPCIVCSVTDKIPKNKLKSKHLVPELLDNIVTDVIKTGKIKCLSALTDKYRPSFGGVSIGHKKVTAGTLGCIVLKNNKKYILSNNHVLANSNNAKIGDEIIQPGPLDGGRSELDQIARLTEFIKINILRKCWNFFPLNLIKKKIIDKPNFVDAAIAEPLCQEDVMSFIDSIGVISRVKNPELGSAVRKTGRTTGFKEGKIIQTDVTISVEYSPYEYAIFKGQFVVQATENKPFSSGGDSGSVIVDKENNAIGLMFAGNDELDYTICSDMNKVLESLRIRLI